MRGIKFVRILKSIATLYFFKWGLKLKKFTNVKEVFLTIIKYQQVIALITYLFDTIDYNLNFRIET